MAIDTAEKRQNISGCGRPYMRSHFPVATPDEEWRIFSGNAYGGNTLSVSAFLFDYFFSNRSSHKWTRHSENV